MPWTPADATRHTKKATTPRLKRAWASAANQHLQETGDEGASVRIGNGVVNKLIARASRTDKR